MNIFILWKKFSAFSKKSSHFVLFHGMYFLGIGITAIVAKIVGKHFLVLNNSQSTWTPFLLPQDWESMF